MNVLVSRALDAISTGYARELDIAVAGIAALCARPGGHTRVARLLTAELSNAVTMLWQRGWQPVDVHRVAGRELTKEHRPLVIDAIADEMATYAAASIDPRWAAQLRELEALPWWPRDATYVQAWHDVHQQSWETVMRGALEVLHLLFTLPEIQRLMPVPGAAISVPEPRGAQPGHAVDERILSRVRALLAKAESTTFEAEAETFTAAAQALMSRHSIDAALLAADQSTSDEPQARRIGIDNPYEGAKAMLLQQVAEANRCRTVWSKPLGFVTVIGFDADLDGVEVLFTSLLLQATRAMTNAGARTDRYGQSRTRSFRQAFLMAFANRIGERLREVMSSEVATVQSRSRSSGRELVPVLAARAADVDRALGALFPQLVSRRVAPRVDAEGWHSGRAAADRASLSGHSAIEQRTQSEAG